LKSKIPLCFYPTQVIFVDDNPDFLKTLSMAFAKQFNVKLFDSAEAALKYVNERRQNMHLSATNETPKPEGESEVWVKRVLTRQNIKRFDDLKITEVSVIVVDYSMPTMNGIEFCEKVENPAIKKILLTGYATSSDAVKAFNNNTIHYYLKKNDDNMLQELESTIHQLQQAYFNELSSSIKAEAIDSGTPFFADPQLARYFRSNCESLGITEYYFLSGPSRFALNTQEGKKYLCVIYTEEDIAEHLQVLSEEHAPRELYADINSHKFIPYFKTADGFYEPSIVRPMDYIHPASCIQGKVNYYCTIILDDTVSAKTTVSPPVAKFH